MKILLKRLWYWLSTQRCDGCGNRCTHRTCVEEFTESGHYICDECLYGPECYRHLSDADYEQM